MIKYDYRRIHKAFGETFIVAHASRRCTDVQVNARCFRFERAVVC